MVWNLSFGVMYGIPEIGYSLGFKVASISCVSYDVLHFYLFIDSFKNTVLSLKLLCLISVLSLTLERHFWISDIILVPCLAAVGDWHSTGLPGQGLPGL